VIVKYTFKETGLPMENIEIIKATFLDISLLREISIQTFTETFEKDNTSENLQKYLNDSFGVDNLYKELINPDSAFYFAKVNDQVIGYLKINFNKAQTEIKDKNALEVERIYVLEKYQGIKVGQFLFDKAQSIAKQTRVNFIWLGVWEHNHKAINFYKKNGFVEFDKHIFKFGNDLQTDIMMRLDL
jgi:ribosomal protein S18 acetylase RimI-like enzyme